MHAHEHNGKDRRTQPSPPRTPIVAQRAQAEATRGGTASSLSSPEALAALQRSAGNAAATHAVQRAGERTPSPNGSDHSDSKTSDSAASTASAKRRSAFSRDKKALQARIKGIHTLGANAEFTASVDKWLQKLEEDFTNVENGLAPAKADTSAVDGIMRGLKAVHALEIPYDWYVRLQDKEGFKDILGMKAEQARADGQLWSKLGKYIPAEEAEIHKGIVLETSVGGRLVDGLLFGFAGFGVSPTMGGLWDRLSETYANGIEGVTAHVYKGITDKSVFTVTEWPRVRERIEKGELGGMTVYLYDFDEKGEKDTLIGTYVVRTQEDFDNLPKVSLEGEAASHQRVVDKAQNALFESESALRAAQTDELRELIERQERKYGKGRIKLRLARTPNNTPAGSSAGSSPRGGSPSGSSQRSGSPVG